MFALDVGQSIGLMFEPGDKAASSQIVMKDLVKPFSFTEWATTFVDKWEWNEAKTCQFLSYDGYDVLGD